jgi:phosphotransferase system enzyme I (PtsI)
MLAESTGRRIREQGVNAEWAVRETIDRLKAPLEAAGTAYFRERAEDLEHVGQHILRHLVGEVVVTDPIDEPMVVVAHDLSPADAARLLAGATLGLVTAVGGPTSHTAILARALEVPAVVGAGKDVLRLVPDSLVIVDGLRGEVVAFPAESERAEAEERGKRYFDFTNRLRDRAGEPAVTRDGVAIELLANVELAAEAAFAIDRGAGGIGLYRTEFLYLDRATLPSEEEQLRVYTDVVRTIAPRPVVFRTFDLGGDKLPTGAVISTMSRALGVRAIRLALRRPDVFRTQVRAILRAAAFGTVEMMLPLVSGLGELREAKAIVDECATELEKEGVEHRRVPVGVMIEVPSAVVMADALAKESAFFSVGTNDLCQYALARDRGDPEVASMSRSLDPAVLRLLEMVSNAASRASLPISMCGDMAADPLALPVALGLGFRRLSIPVGTIGVVRAIVCAIRGDRARDVAAEALACTTADEVRDLVVEAFRDELGEIWREQGVLRTSDG